MKKFNLTADIILNKKFSTELSGYNAMEVDEYLDKMIEDYVTYDDMLKTQQSIVEEKVKLITQKEEIIEKMNIEINNLKNQLKESSKVSNYELLKEIRKIKDGK